MRCFQQVDQKHQLVMVVSRLSVQSGAGGAKHGVSTISWIELKLIFKNKAQGE